ncbi:hypothetical protein LMG26411_06678 [Cupriavidus numazuensis]|uniref:Uncharacterized protein n=1 Tax=Cupriavidus numazuensis TaxID=221992 RepID=A0ABM8TSQ0_9BURK|nr:hypothetical protein LMG26411_06678 [Cupriavidus numazuensis]
MDGPRVHFCNAGLVRMTQYIEARTQRPMAPYDIHVCNRFESPPCIAHPLHAAVALSICRMSSSILAPIIGVSYAPLRLGPRLVVAIIGVGTKSAVLPVTSTGALAGFLGAVTLVGNMRQRHKRVTTGETKVGRFHECPPSRVATGARRRLELSRRTRCARNIQFSDSLADESHTFRTSHGRRRLKSHTLRSPRKSLVDFMGSFQLGLLLARRRLARQRNHRPEMG